MRISTILLVALVAFSACTEAEDGGPTSVSPEISQEDSGLRPTAKTSSPAEFAAEFDAFAEEVAERYPDLFIEAALRDDAAEGCVFLTEVDPTTRESISALAKGLPGDVCIAPVPSDAQEISDLLERVSQRLERLAPEAEITSGYRDTDHTLIVEIFNLGDLAFDPAFKQQVDEELFGLAPNIRVRTYRDPFPLEGEETALPNSGLKRPSRSITGPTAT